MSGQDQGHERPARLPDRTRSTDRLSQHTPGPWIYDGRSQIVEAERPHMRICFLPSDHERYATSEFNARLIAAAPDLLEALRDLIEVADGIIEYTDQCDRARAVIAKATGGAS